MKGYEYADKLGKALKLFRDTYLAALEEGYSTTLEIKTSDEVKRIQCWDDLHFVAHIVEHQTWAVSTQDKENE